MFYCIRLYELHSEYVCYFQFCKWHYLYSCVCMNVWIVLFCILTNACLNILNAQFFSLGLKSAKTIWATIMCTSYLVLITEVYDDDIQLIRIPSHLVVHVVRLSWFDVQVAFICIYKYKSLLYTPNQPISPRICGVRFWTKNHHITLSLLSNIFLLLNLQLNTIVYSPFSFGQSCFFKMLRKMIRLELQPCVYGEFPAIFGWNLNRQ